MAKIRGSSARNRHVWRTNSAATADATVTVAGCPTVAALGGRAAAPTAPAVTAPAASVTGRARCAGVLATVCHGGACCSNSGRRIVRNRTSSRRRGSTVAVAASRRAALLTSDAVRDGAIVGHKNATAVENSIPIERTADCNPADCNRANCNRADCNPAGTSTAATRPGS